MARVLSELRVLVHELALNDDVVEVLLPSGRPHDIEGQLWDYKKHLRVAGGATEEERRRNKAAWGELFKDVVAFHNAYGGYIVFGVADRGRDRITGCTEEFDCGDFNKQLQSYTEANIECLFRFIAVPGRPTETQIALLLIPRRQTGVAPVRFRKEGPIKANGAHLGRAALPRRPHGALADGPAHPVRSARRRPVRSRGRTADGGGNGRGPYGRHGWAASGCC